MNVKLFLGIALFLIGIVTAAIGIAAGFGPESGTAVDSAAPAAEPFGLTLTNMAIPVIAGLSLAAGALLIGLSMGNWKNPRTHHEPGDEIVDPEGYHKMKHV